MYLLLGTYSASLGRHAGLGNLKCAVSSSTEFVVADRAQQGRICRPCPFSRALFEPEWDLASDLLTLQLQRTISCPRTFQRNSVSTQLLTSVFGQHSNFSRCVFLVTKVEFQGTFPHDGNKSSLQIVSLLKGHFFVLLFLIVMCA